MADPPVHERYAAALSALTDSDAVLQALGRDLGAGPWRRTYARFSPDAPAFATLVFERPGDPPEMIVVEAHVRRPETRAVTCRASAADAWLVAFDATADRRLRTLGT